MAACLVTDKLFRVVQLCSMPCRRYRRAAAPAQDVPHGRTTPVASEASQPVAGVASAEQAKSDARQQQSSEAAKPAAVMAAAVAPEADPQPCGGDGAQTLNGIDNPEAEAVRELPLIRIIVDEARGLPEACSGALA